MTTATKIPPLSPTATDDGPTVLCLLMGASFFGQCRHTRCREIHAAVVAAETIIRGRGAL